jgi:hypothetical protein
MNKNWQRFAQIQQSPKRIAYLLKQPKNRLDMYLEVYKEIHNNDSVNSEVGEVAGNKIPD